MSLAEYFDLVWRLDDDLWRPVVLFDDTYDGGIWICICGLAYGDESRIKDLEAMFNLDDP